MTKKTEVNRLRNELTGIILITIGILMLFSVFSSSTSGILGKVIKKILIAVVGAGAFIFPLIIIFIGVCYIFKNNKIYFNKKFFGIILFIITTLMLLSMLNLNLFYINDDVASGINKIYESQLIWQGGIIGYLIDIPLFKLFGNVGFYVILISLYIISFLLVCNISLYDMAMSIKQKSIKEPIKKSDSNNGSNEKESFVNNINKRIKILDFMKSGDIKQGDSAPNIIESPIPEITKEISSDTDNSINEELDKEINTKKNYLYNFPTLDLLRQNIQSKLNKEDKKDLISSATKLEKTLSSFGVEAKVIQVSKGPSVTRFELQPSPGVKVSKIVNLADDIALNLASSGVRIEAPIPGKSAVGIEVPNKDLTPVYIREVIESEEFKNSKNTLAVCLGKDISGNCVSTDLVKMPHLLIAGATGSGKSVCINSLIVSLLYKYSPDDVKLLMIDPKVVELSIYNGIPHLLIPVVTDPKKAAGALNWAVNEMTRRYKLFADINVRNIESYNELYIKNKIESKLPVIVIIIDELADLMMVCANDIEDYIGRLAQMARAAGMHLVIATQRPSVDVITGVIKANIPSRISFAVSSQIDSRTILDMAGAEKLLGKGDMLFYPVAEAKPIRIQGAFISEDEVDKVVTYIKDQEGEPIYENDIIEEIDTAASEGESDKDELLEEAIRIVIQMKQASTSLLQRRLRIGYNRAARIIEQMETRGIISSRDGSKPRQILIDENNIDYGDYFQGND